MGWLSTTLPGPFLRPPKTGLIWDRLDAAGVGWANYYVEVPEVGLWPRNLLHYRDHLHAIERFHDDCQAGTLPAVTLITPDTAFLSDGEYQDDQLGEAFTAWIYESLRQSSQWPTLMFVVTWDEGGGFYDHVPPPAAPKPDDVPPAIHVPPDEPGGYDRYGFRDALHCRLALLQARARLVVGLRPHLHPGHDRAALAAAPAHRS